MSGNRGRQPTRASREALPPVGFGGYWWDLLVRGKLPEPEIPRYVQDVVGAAENGLVGFCRLVWATAWGGMPRESRPPDWEAAMDAVDRLFPGVGEREVTGILAAANAVARTFTIYWGVPSLETHWFCARCRRSRPIEDFDDRWTHTCRRRHRS